MTEHSTSSLPTVPKTLAIDFGTTRIGLAISYGTLAEPLQILENTDQALSTLQKILDEQGVSQVVIGISEGKMAEQTLQFVDQLKKRTPLPIILVDETLSSWEIHRQLAERDQKKQTYKGPIDHYAAAHFLQEYLDEQSSRV